MKLLNISKSNIPDHPIIEVSEKPMFTESIKLDHLILIHVK
jgi:hypothetical protein